MPKKASRGECPPDHKHAESSTCYHQHRCGCAPCREANSERQRKRRKNIAYGRWVETLVPTEPVARHIDALVADGMPLREIATAAGVSHSSVYRVRKHPYMRAAVAQKIMRVRGRAPAPRSLVDATGTRRRLQALVRIGWTNEELVDRLGSGTRYVSTLLTAERVFEETRVAVAALYEELWDVTPPDTFGSRRAKLRAERNGWVGPLAWDDDTIDDPNAKPDTDGEEIDEPVIDEVAVARALDGWRVELTREEQHEVIRRGHALKWTDRELGIATGLNVKQAAYIRGKVLGLPAWTAEERAERPLAA